jgi:putative ABC transport system permease protein
MLKFAVRNLLKTRLFGILNITGLAVGMAAAVLILLWVQNELSFRFVSCQSFPNVSNYYA